MSATASLRRCNRSLKTPVIIVSGIKSNRTSAPTPSSLIIVLWRFPKDGWDTGSGGGGVWASGMRAMLNQQALLGNKLNRPLLSLTGQQSEIYRNSEFVRLEIAIAGEFARLRA